jgi:aminopeptidase N
MFGFYRKYDTATQDDLWGHLTAQAHKDGTLPEFLEVKTIMDTWTLQTGYPVINVKRNYGSANKSADLTQTRFFSVAEKEDLTTKWWVPVTFSTPGGDFSQTNVKVWMNPDEDVVRLDGLPEDEQAVIFNVKATGKCLIILFSGTTNTHRWERWHL